MNTYKILGLEIMARDIANPLLFSTNYSKDGWRYPTNDEFTFLLKLSDELGILGLVKGRDHYYPSKEKETGWCQWQMTTDAYGQDVMWPHYRLVRDI